MKDGFQINEISKFFNVPASTLRYWEEMGVLAAKKNPENGYRIYTVSDLMTISDILFYKNLGIPLKKIRWHIRICVCNKQKQSGSSNWL